MDEDDDDDILTLSAAVVAAIAVKRRKRRQQRSCWVRREELGCHETLEVKWNLDQRISKHASIYIH